MYKIKGFKESLHRPYQTFVVNNSRYYLWVFHYMLKNFKGFLYDLFFPSSLSPSIFFTFYFLHASRICIFAWDNLRQIVDLVQMLHIYMNHFFLLWWLLFIRKTISLILSIEVNPKLALVVLYVMTPTILGCNTIFTAAYLPFYIFFPSTPVCYMHFPAKNSIFQPAASNLTLLFFCREFLFAVLFWYLCRGILIFVPWLFFVPWFCNILCPGFFCAAVFWYLYLRYCFHIFLLWHLWATVIIIAGI